MSDIKVTMRIPEVSNLIYLSIQRRRKSSTPIPAAADKEMAGAIPPTAWGPGKWPATAAA